MTGAALQALAVVGRANGGAARRAVAYLRASQNGRRRLRPDDGPQLERAVDRLRRAGPGRGGRRRVAVVSRALAYLRRLQRADGSIAYSATSSQTPVWVTAQALMALAAGAAADQRPSRARSRRRSGSPDRRAAGAARARAEGGRRIGPGRRRRGEERRAGRHPKPPAPAAAADDSGQTSNFEDSTTPEPATGKPASTLRLDPADSDGGVSVWVVIAASAAALRCCTCCGAACAAAAGSSRRARGRSNGPSRGPAGRARRWRATWRRGPRGSAPAAALDVSAVPITSATSRGGEAPFLLDLHGLLAHRLDHPPVEPLAPPAAMAVGELVGERVALLPDRRLDAAGLDHDHVDALAAQLAPQRVAERLERELRRRCRRPAAAAPRGRRSSSRCTIRPRPRRSAGRSTCVTATCPTRLTSSCWRSWSIGRNSSGAATPMPALFTSPASAPSPSSSPTAAIVPGVGHVELDGAQPAAREPLGVLVACAPPPPASKPSSRRWSAVASPMPVEAPVTRTVPEAMRGRPYSLASIAVEVDEAIRTRRTHKAYGGEPVRARDARRAVRAGALGAEPPRDEPVALPRARPGFARAAEGGRRPRGGGEARTGADAHGRLGAAAPVTRCRTRRTLCAAAVASYIVLLGAHSRGLAGYWRTPEVLRRAEGRAAIGVGEDEHVLGLLHLGPPRQEKEAPGRLPPGEFVTYLS